MEIKITLITLILSSTAIKGFKLPQKRDLDDELRKQFPNLPKKFFTAPQDVNHVDQNEILIDSYYPLTEADFERAKSLTDKDLAPSGDESLLYSQDLFEGDIFGPLVSLNFKFHILSLTCSLKFYNDPLLSETSQRSLNLSAKEANEFFLLKTQKGRNAIIDLSATWPEGRIPYVVSRRMTERDRAVLAAAIQTYNEKTCIRYVPKNISDVDFVYIFPGGGCASQVGRAGGMQYVSLGLGCSYVGITQHELMHVTGFWHEQSRADRDEYIRIIWENIEPGMEYNFDKYTWNDIQSLQEPYDYGSVMHYGTHAFAKGYGPTIQTLDGVPRTMGQRVGLSETDLEKINKLYGCKNYLKNKQFVLSNHHVG